MPSRERRGSKAHVQFMVLCTGLLLGACLPFRAPAAETSLPVLISTAKITQPALTPTTAPAGDITSPEPLPSAGTAPAGQASPATTLSAATGSTSINPFPTHAFTICSPLQDVTLADLVQPDLLKNPFLPSRPGMDDGHFGADFAYWSRGAHKQMLGLPVLSALEGRVAGVIQNRMPYGNAVIIETPLNALPATWQPVFPTPAPTVQPAPNLLCPPDPAEYAIDAGKSLYLLYAHLKQSPAVVLEQPIACGQEIGEVGTTGRSVNPHLHLETRIGPAGVTFSEMAHYDNAATESEMGTYCTWRVSGLFQAFDPLEILSLQP